MYILLLVFIISVSSKTNGKLIELNHKGLDQNSLYWPEPKNEPFQLTILDRGFTEDGYW